MRRFQDRGCPIRKALIVSYRRAIMAEDKATAEALAEILVQRGEFPEAAPGCKWLTDAMAIFIRG